ncbi:MAG: histidine--tRNA ligase [Phycisphaerales bacterium]
MSSHLFQPPAGTRDFYPAEFSRRRYIVEAWRAAAVRHGFDEIDGPTFEHLDVYTAKSGPEIVSQLFSFRRAGGEKDYALRPEFTPTLARMFAEHAGSLSKPTKWFWTQNCFRAEKNQRGRLREFWQWNCDILGDASPGADAEVIGVSVGLLRDLGLRPEHVRVKLSDRVVVGRILESAGVRAEKVGEAFELLDLRGKVSREHLVKEAGALGLDLNAFDSVSVAIARAFAERRHDDLLGLAGANDLGSLGGLAQDALYRLRDLARELDAAGLIEWCDLELSVVRGLAYYTGTVFEVHEVSGKERAIAGGGRYDKLVETFGGPATPAVGFGMGDVVLSLVLGDRGLMPDDKAMAGRLGLRPDVFVISNGTPEADAALPRVVTKLRTAGLHARRSYKGTKNIGKLLKEASEAMGGSRYAAIIEGAAEVTLKNLETGAQERVPMEGLEKRVVAAVG